MKFIPPYQNQLRAIRKERGLRQLDVACFFGFTTTDRISRWEKGTALPGIVNLFKLAVLYRVATHELYPEMFRDVMEFYQGK